MLAARTELTAGTRASCPNCLGGVIYYGQSGYGISHPLASPPEMATLAGAEAREIVRLEQVAEAVAAINRPISCP